MSDSKRIAKNTLMLYIRMFIMMAASLYTSRVVLDVLGVDDYGIYNIIGGVIVLFSFLNTALLQATQRFLNYELGKGNDKSLNLYFCMSMNSYIILSIIFFILAETIGLWFVNTQLNIPDERMAAANWVYQLSVLTFIINLIRVPYNATIVAYEKMVFFAYLSLLEAVLKLILVYLLFIISFDKLIFYAFLCLFIALIITFIFKIYCNHNFNITKYKYIWDGKVFRQLFSFSSWSLFGSLSNVLASQGLNIIVNIFYGVAINAALGIANQVSASITQFVSNFQVAFNPQIVKLYAVKEFKALNNLVFRSSKLSYYLLFIIAFPIILKMDAILEIWLVDVPEYTAVFAKLMLVFMLIDALNGPLWMYSQATGKIRNYQIMVGVLVFLNIPLIYFALKLSFPVWTIWGIRILVNIIVSIARYIFMKKVYLFPIKDYLKSVIVTIVVVTVVILPVPIYVSNHLHINVWIDIIFTTLISVVVSIIAIYCFGLTKDEKNTIILFIRSKISKMINH